MTQTVRHGRPRDTTAIVKRQVIRAAIALLTRAGLLVTDTWADDTVTLSIVIPPDNTHDDRLRLAQEST